MDDNSFWNCTFLYSSCENWLNLRNKYCGLSFLGFKHWSSAHKTNAISDKDTIICKETELQTLHVEKKCHFVADFN